MSPESPGPSPLAERPERDEAGQRARGHAPTEPPNLTAGRRLARERVLGLLYEAEAKGVSPAGDRIDQLIAQTTLGWELGRLARVDLAILRLAVAELLEVPEVPVAVVIDEAVELAKRFSTEHSGRFVNGVLASMVDEVRPGLPPRPGEPADERATGPSGGGPG
ncbi:transcription antitermination factor NusB [Aciditerrimonas ferrireducens]|nr:transcription antitermination factor NusB [Aciditerrimonas ferrireducens]MCK4177230.1 transcription antitermination factor NusB [Aciditerrimonas ferrireducens]